MNKLKTTDVHQLRYSIDIEIDGLTNCLVDKTTGKQLETEYTGLNITQALNTKFKKEGWKFDWEKHGGKELYALKIKGNNTIQGLISVTHYQGYTYIHLVEANPHNISKSGKYKGVGGHLFAIACYESKKHGNGGFVCFHAKTRLVDYYKETLNAYSFASKEDMAINEYEAQKLIDKYIKK